MSKRKLIKDLVIKTIKNNKNTKNIMEVVQKNKTVKTLKSIIQKEINYEVQKMIENYGMKSILKNMIHHLEKIGDEDRVLMLRGELEKVLEQYEKIYNGRINERLI